MRGIAATKVNTAVVATAIEYGLFSGDTSGGKNQNNPTFVTAVLKNNGTTKFAIRGGNATSGSLSTYYKDALPACRRTLSPPATASSAQATSRRAWLGASQSFRRVAQIS
jgi:hypothetical protein